MRALATTTLAMMVACTAAPHHPRGDGRAQRVVTIDELGLALWVPDDWVLRSSQGAWLLNGPADTPAAYTTISVQAVRPMTTALDTLLTRAYARSEALYDVHFDAKVLEIIDGELALGYSVAFTSEERARRRTGVLIDLPPYVVDVSYAAPDDLFATSISVFEDALATLEVESAN